MKQSGKVNGLDIIDESLSSFDIANSFSKTSFIICLKKTTHAKMHHKQIGKKELTRKVEDIFTKILCNPKAKAMQNVLFKLSIREIMFVTF